MTTRHELKRDRIAVRFSQEALGRAVGLSQAAISQMETGLLPITARWAQRITAAIERRRNVLGKLSNSRFFDS